MEQTGPQRVNVLYVITKSNFGGAQRYVYDLATHLSKQRFNPSVAAGGSGVLFEKLSHAGIHTHSIPSLERDVRFLGDIRSFMRLYALFRDTRPHTVHFSSPKAAGLGSLAARILRVPRIVVTIHGWSFNESRPRWQQSLIWFFSWITVLLSHKTIVICTSDFEQGKRMPGTTKKLHLIHNGIESFPLFSKEEAREKLFSSDEMEAHRNNVWAITNAELHPNKNLFTAIDAIASHNAHAKQKIFYSIMSDGELREKLVQHVEEKNLSKYVRFLGYVDEGRRYLYAFDLFFFPSVKEGLPYALLEAGIAQLPTVASAVGGIPDIIEHEKNGLLVDPRDTKSLARGLSQLVENPTLRRMYGEALGKRVQEQFSVNTMVEDTAALYL